MEEIAGKPYWRISFDSGGGPADSVGDQFISEVGLSRISDLFVFSGGWDTSASRAEDLYNDMFPRLDAAAARSSLTSTGYAGVFWPSIGFPDPAPARLTALPADQVASNPGMVDAVLSGAEIATTLAQFYPEVGDVTALNQMGALIDQGLSAAVNGAPYDSGQQDRVEQFHALLETLVRSTIDAAEDRGEEPLISSTTPVQDYARIAHVMGSVPAVAKLGLVDLRNIWNGAKEALRIASYYEMKGRAGNIGEFGLGPTLARLHTASPSVRVHLIGHSFGARLVSYAIRGITSRDHSPVASLCLIQGAFSHWSFTPGPNMPWGGPGGLAGYADRVAGARVSTFSKYDWAIGHWYPRASFLSQTDNSLAMQLTGAPSQWGGLGADGYQGVDPAVDLDIDTDGLPYSLKSGQFYRINAEAVIRDTSQSAFSGAHSDIRHDEVANLILAAATSNPSGSAPIMTPAEPALPPKKATGTKRSWSFLTSVSFWLPLVWTYIAFAGLVIIIVYAFATPGQSTRHAGVGLLTAFASLCAGALFGFLFGIPRLVSSGDLRHHTTPDTIAQIKSPPAGEQSGAADQGSPGSPPRSFVPSSNLAEVSDWLTKLLLGAGLVSLTQLGGPLGRLNQGVAAGLGATGGSGPAQVMAAAIMVTYVVLGFLYGYIVTTLWYTRRIEHLMAG
jgi:hypothetical protein